MFPSLYRHHRFVSIDHLCRFHTLLTVFDRDEFQKRQNYWCEDCDKFISDKRQFQSEIHTLRYTFKCHYPKQPHALNEEVIQVYEKLLDLNQQICVIL